MAIDDDYELIIFTSISGLRDRTDEKKRRRKKEAEREFKRKQKAKQALKKKIERIRQVRVCGDHQTLSCDVC
mgnify:FL=1